MEKELWPQRLTAEHLPALTEELACIEKPLEEQYFAARQASADLAKEQEALRADPPPLELEPLRHRSRDATSPVEGRPWQSDES